MSTIEPLQIALADPHVFERGIGAGGIATVYLAHDLRHQREVAFEILKPQLGAVVRSMRGSSPESEVQRIKLKCLLK